MQDLVDYVNVLKTAMEERMVESVSEMSQISGNIKRGKPLVWDFTCSDPICQLKISLLTIQQQTTPKKVFLRNVQCTIPKVFSLFKVEIKHDP